MQVEIIKFKPNRNFESVQIALAFASNTAQGGYYVGLIHQLESTTLAS